MGTLVPLTSEDWARVRFDYECTHRKLFDICAEHGISERTLHDRVKRWGWTRRSAGLVAREGPPPMVVLSLPAPQSRFTSPHSSPDGERPLAYGGEVGSRSDPGEGVQVTEMDEPPHPSPLPRSSPNRELSLAYGEREQIDVGVSSEPSLLAVQDGRERPFAVPDARPIGERLQGAIAQVMPALETTLSSLAAGPMQPRQMEQAARTLGSLTRTLRELNGLVAEYGAPGSDDDPAQDADALRESLKRQIDELIEQERQERPRRYLAAWEEFAAEVADAMLL